MLYDRIEDEGIQNFVPVHDRDGRVIEFNVTTLKNNSYIISCGDTGMQIREVY